MVEGWWTYNYLDFSPKIPLCPLIPVPGELLEAILTGAAADKKGPLMGWLNNVHVTITKSLSQKQYQSVSMVLSKSQDFDEFIHENERNK